MKSISWGIGMVRTRSARKTKAPLSTATSNGVRPA